MQRRKGNGCVEMECECRSGPLGNDAPLRRMGFVRKSSSLWRTNTNRQTALILDKGHRQIRCIATYFDGSKRTNEKYENIVVLCFQYHRFRQFFGCGKTTRCAGNSLFDQADTPPYTSNNRRSKTFKPLCYILTIAADASSDVP